MVESEISNSYIALMQIKFKFKNLKSFCGKKDAFDCAEIRARVFRLPVDCFNQLSYTGPWLESWHSRMRLFFHRTISISLNLNNHNNIEDSICYS